MLVHSIEKKLAKKCSISVFATDIDEAALAYARKGVYSSKEIESIPKTFLEKYFILKGNSYSISKTLRDQILFARHNVFQDPPFLRLDLISCRNLLIYLDQPLQKQVFKIFHYSLLNHGLLLLGKSETAGQGSELFAPKSPKVRFFKKVSDQKKELPKLAKIQDRILLGNSKTNSLAPVISNGSSIGISEELLAKEYIVKALLPPTFLINKKGVIVQTVGDVRKVVIDGKPLIHRNIKDVLLSSLKKYAITLLANPDKNKSSFPCTIFEFPKSSSRLEEKFYYLSFFIDTSKYSMDIKNNIKKNGNNKGTLQNFKALEIELMAAKEQLQTVIEELETTNEELQSTNEELQSSNEELSSSNEELETANEELQSSNEELITLNDELNVKSNELSAAHGDLENIQNSVQVPILLFNDEKHLLRFNHAAKLLLPHLAQHASFVLTSGSFPSELKIIYEHFDQVLKTGEVFVSMVEFAGSYWSLKMSPYFQVVGKVTGVIVVLFDMTDIINVKNSLTESEQRLNSFLNHTPALVTLKDLTGKYLMVNQAFAENIGQAASKIVGLEDDHIFPDKLVQKIRDIEVLTLRSKKSYDHEEMFPSVKGPTVLLASYFPLLNQKNQVYGIGCIRTDVSVLKENEKTIQEQKALLYNAAKLSSLGEMASGIAHELNNPLQLILGKTELIKFQLAKEIIDFEKLKAHTDKILSTTALMGKIIKGLKIFARDGSRDPYQSTSISLIIDEVQTLCTPKAENLEITLKIASVPPDLKMECQQVQIIQLLVNLISNAFDAIENLTEKWVELRVTKFNTEVEISVTDSGKGISAEIQEKMMLPFYTTKIIGKGTGLGLSISRSIAESHNGKLIYMLESGHTSFIVSLPLIQTSKPN